MAGGVQTTMPIKRGVSLRGVARTPHRIRRIAQIARVLSRHGFGHAVQSLRLQHFAPGVASIASRRPGVPKQIEHISAPRRLAMVFEELGPTYVKIGQLLSTRPDIIPQDYVVELARLQDNVAPFPSKDAYATIEHELGRPISELFARFDPAPLAAGSIAQVHTARLPSGHEVVVKVKRPNADRTIRADLDVLAVLAEWWERFEELRPFQPLMLVEEFSKSIQRELDFVTEASYTAKFAKMLASEPHVRVPTVFWSHTTPSVLTLERLQGTSVSHREKLLAEGADLPTIAHHMFSVFMKQYFDHGLFHADPHPGNLLVTPEGQLALLDFGMVGHLSDELRRDLGNMLFALVRKDLDMVVDVSIEVGSIPDELELGPLKNDMLQMLDKYYGIPMKQIDLKRAFTDMMRITREHQLLMPRDLVLLGKSLVTVTALAKTLNPDLNLVDEVRPHAMRVLRNKISPVQIAKDALDQSWQVSNLLRRLPREIRQFTRKTLAGRLQLQLKVHELDFLTTEIDRASNRIAFSLIVAAVITGSSLVIHARIKPFFSEIPIIGEYLPPLPIIGGAGYLLAAVLGLVLAIAIWRSGKL
jgi:ubiquinone biosynthesis protein